MEKLKGIWELLQHMIKKQFKDVVNWLTGFM